MSSELDFAGGWKKINQSFLNEVHLFNKDIQNDRVTDEEIDRIHQAVEQQLKEIAKFADEASKREEDLAKEDCLGPRIKGSIPLGGILGLKNTTTIGGAIMTVYDHDNITLKWCGVAIIIAAQALDLIFYFYNNKVQMTQFEVMKLNSEYRKAESQIKLFEKFLRKYKKIQIVKEGQVGQTIIHQYSQKGLKPHLPITKQDRVSTPPQSIRSLGVRSSVPLEEPKSQQQIEMQSCLQTYEALPSNLKNDELLGGIVNSFITKLPEDHPLKSPPSRQLSVDESQGDSLSPFASFTVSTTKADGVVENGIASSAFDNKDSGWGQVEEAGENYLHGGMLSPTSPHYEGDRFSNKIKDFFGITGNFKFERRRNGRVVIKKPSPPITEISGIKKTDSGKNIKLPVLSSIFVEK